MGYALAVTYPCCGNLGGGGFMLIHSAEGENIFIDFREKAPLAANKNMYLDSEGKVKQKLSTEGYLAVGVPGTVKGLNYALSKYGTMNLEQIISPAIELAEKGFILQAGDIKFLNAGKKRFQKQANVASIFLKSGKKSYQVGDRLIQKDLATTLKIIAKGGEKGFYQGQIAQQIAKASEENNGLLTLADFSSYEIAQRKPISCNYKDYTVITAPPPGGGTTLCQMLNILSGYQLKSKAQDLHWFFSAMLYAYADRNTYLGDPDFVDNPVAKLLSKDYAVQIRNQISDSLNIEPKTLFPQTNNAQEGNNTTHYSVVDRAGNAVAVTYTLNSNFGAGVIAKNTGFFLNNEMNDFTLKPGEANQFGLVQGNANEIAPGKRPLSSMSPTIVLKEGQVFLVTGSPGGSTIPTTVLQIITNIIDYDLDLAAAVNTPRIHYQGLPNLVFSEPYAVSNQKFVGLWEKGYKVIPFLTWGAAESILFDWETETYMGGNDSRKSSGKAVAY